jgi:hypothetical protein
MVYINYIKKNLKKLCLNKLTKNQLKNLFKQLKLLLKCQLKFLFNNQFNLLIHYLLKIHLKHTPKPFAIILNKNPDFEYYIYLIIIL